MSVIPGIPATPPMPSGSNHEVKPLLDGVQIFRELYSDIQQAQDNIYFANWYFNTNFLIDRRGKLLTEFCVEQLNRYQTLKIYFLLWDWPLLPGLWKSDFSFIDPADERRLFIEQKTNLFLGSHHQKFVLTDIDPTIPSESRGAALHCMSANLANPYWDTAGHPIPRLTGVNQSRHETGIRVKGPLIHDFEEEFRRRWVEAGGSSLPASQFDATATATVHAKALIKKARDRPPNDLYDWYKNKILAIQKFFYFEGQYFAHKQFTKLLCKKYLSAEAANAPIRGVIVLPHIPDMEITLRGDTFGELRRLRFATVKRFKNPRQDQWIERPTGGWKLIANVRDRETRSRHIRNKAKLMDHTGKVTLWNHVNKIEGGVELFRVVANDDEHPYVYVHSKLAIIDGEYTIGSCNIATQSFDKDSEANVLVIGAEETSDVIRLIWTHLIKNGPAPQTLDAWMDELSATAKDNMHRRGHQWPDGRLHVFPINRYR